MALSMAQMLPIFPVISRSSISRKSFYSLSNSKFNLAPAFIQKNSELIQKRSRSKVCKTFAASELNFDLAPPPIDGDLQDTMLEYGAIFSEEGIVESFENNVEALNAARNSAAVYDMSHFGRIRITGDDRIRFLHNQSTANFQILKEGQGCFTVFITPTGRTIDLAFALIMKTSVLLLVSPEMTDKLTSMLDKYMFFADKVKIENISKKTSLLLLLGPKTNDYMKEWNLDQVINQPVGYHSTFKFDDFAVTVGVGCSFSENEYFFLSSSENMDKIWRRFIENDIVPMGDDVWKILRVLNGRPVPGKELTDEYNPLEAGLWKTISVNKGCYIGQETIARVITYNSVKKQLWGFKCEKMIEDGTDIIVEEKKIGKITSCVYDEEKKEYFALGYVRINFVEEGKEFDIHGSKATLTNVPFLTRELPPN